MLQSHLLSFLKLGWVSLYGCMRIRFNSLISYEQANLRSMHQDCIVLCFLIYISPLTAVVIL